MATMQKRIKLTAPQLRYVSTTAPHPLFVGGYASGKTYANIMRAISLKLKYPNQNIAYYLPTYDLIRTIGYPRFSETLDDMRLSYTLNKSDATIQFGKNGLMIFRTMDTPERIIGFEVSDSLVDELDTLPTEKAREVWTKIVARNRQKKPDGAPNTIGTATTPEGFRFVHEMWVKYPKAGYEVIRAATQTNRHLPDGYIDSLKAIYPTSLLQAYLMGEFCNLTSGSVYSEFDRALNASAETIKDGEPLHIGMDFNVSKMAAVIFVLRNGDPHAVAELTDVFDTPAMIAIIKERFSGHSIFVYPDASGQARKSNNASQSDLSLLREARFTVLNNNRNPAVKDRILATNRMIHVSGVRALRVNIDGCPAFVEALEKQAYDKNGEPDKSSGLDHIIDAGTYFIAYKFPIVKVSATQGSASMR